MRLVGANLNSSHFIDDLYHVAGEADPEGEASIDPIRKGVIVHNDRVDRCTCRNARVDDYRLLLMTSGRFVWSRV